MAERTAWRICPAIDWESAFAVMSGRLAGLWPTKPDNRWRVSRSPELHAACEMRIKMMGVAG
jgi:hypothetical protein